MFRFYMGNTSEFIINIDNEFEEKIKSYIKYFFLRMKENDKNVYRVINPRDNIFKFLLRIVTKNLTIERCGAGKSKSILYTDGEQYLCDYCLGIRDLSLNNYTVKENQNCLSCDYNTLCGGYCKFEKYCENNFSCLVTPLIVNTIIVELSELEIYYSHIFDN